MIAGLFLSLATYTRDEIVTGWLVPHGGIIRVGARSGGLVEHLLVKEGDIVHAGQPIVEIRLVTTLTGGVDIAAATERAQNAQRQANRAQADAARRKLLAEQADLGPKLAKLRAQLLEQRQQIEYQKQRIALARADVGRFERLVKEVAAAERDLDTSRATLLAQQQSLAQDEASALGMEQQIQEVNARLHAIPHDLATVDANAATAVAELDEKRIQSSAQDLDLVVATVGGRILALPANPGQSLEPGATVAVISPAGSSLEAELYVPSRAIGFVRLGQEVKVMYQAFPHEKFGTSKATLVSISRTILVPAEVAIPGISPQQEPVFRVRARLDEQVEHAYGQVIPLQPGMLLNASIVFDRRTLFEWLLDPIYAVRR